MSNPPSPEEFNIQMVNQATEINCLSQMSPRVLAYRS